MMGLSLTFGPLTTGLLFVLTIVGSTVVWLKALRRHPNLDGMPGSTLEVIIEVVRQRFHIIPAFMSYAQKHGGIAFVRSGFTSKSDLVVLSTAEYLQTFYSSRVNTTRSDHYLPLKEVAGMGLFTTSGPEWRRLRDLAITTFYNSPAEKLMKPIYEEIEHMIAAFKEKAAHGNVFPAQGILKNAVLRSLNVNLLGEPVNETIEGMMASSNWYMRIMFKRISNMLYRYKPLFSILPEGRIFYKKTAQLQIDLESVVQKVRRQFEDFTTKGNVPDVFVYRMMSAKETDETVVNEALVTYMAATDTSSMAMGYALTCMGLYPDVQQKVYEEDAVIQEKLAGRALTPDDLKEYLYLDRVIKETLRMFPGVPFLGRKLEEDTYFGKYLVPKGTNVAALQITSNYREEHFREPLKFDPDRFLPSNLHLIPPYAFNPFSAGPRNCLGTRYSNMVLKMFLSAIIRNFKVTSAYSSMKETLSNTVTEMTLKDKNEFPLIFELRHENQDS